MDMEIVPEEITEFSLRWLIRMISKRRTAMITEDIITVVLL